MPSLRERMQRLDTLLYRMVCAVAGVAVISMVILTFIDVLGRHFFTAVPGASEIISIQLSIVFFAGMSIVIRENGHIVVGILASKYNATFQVIERVITTTVSMVVMGLITWLIFTQGGKLKASLTLSPYLGFEVAYLAWVLSVLVAIATLFSVLKLIGLAQPASADNATTSRHRASRSETGSPETGVTDGEA